MDIRGVSLQSYADSNDGQLSSLEYHERIDSVHILVSTREFSLESTLLPWFVDVTSHITKLNLARTILRRWRLHI